jgi:PBP1b-binding outer membrane lipoprotein LpoB
MSRLCTLFFLSGVTNVLAAIWKQKPEDISNGSFQHIHMFIGNNFVALNNDRWALSKQQLGTAHMTNTKNYRSV